MEKIAPNICQLEKSVFVIVGPEGTTNFGIVRGDDGCALVIDSDIRRIDEIEAALSMTGCSKVSYLFNTHENFDHSSANHYFEKKGATVIASEGCWKALMKDGEAKFAEMGGPVPELWQRFPDLKMGLPHVTFSDTASVYLQGITSRLRYSAFQGQGHSKGDAVVFFEKEGILFAGDLLYVDFHPVTIYGHISNWLQSIDRLRGEDFKSVVPGHGPVVEGQAAGKQAFAKFRSYLEDFHEQLLTAASGRQSAEEVRAHMMSGAYARLGKTWMVQRNIEYFLKEAR
ncbi:MAG: MBL fold metallo-hydrolase [Deltaproteobacteria bacterium]|nr:MBL fold metallo-hydrolase [Deltaproteobacteria bacterium]